MCLEKRKLYTVYGHISSGIRPCERQRRFEVAFEALPSTTNGNGALTSKTGFCPRLTGLINPRTLSPSCRPPHPFFTETRFGFCGRCQAYYRSSGFASFFSTETGIRDDQVILKLVPFAGEDVGGGIMKLEDIRWKTIMWGEEGRKRREWRGELEERERVWEKGEEEQEKLEETEKKESGTGSSRHTAATITDSDEADEAIKRTLTSSYHNVLARLAIPTSDYQPIPPLNNSQDTNLTLSALGERDNDEHKRRIQGNTVVEQNITTNTTDLQPESSISSAEDIYNYDYHQLSEITKERTSQYTKSRPSKELASQPSSDSFPGIVTSLSPIPRKKTTISPMGQSTSKCNRTHTVRLTKSNLARLLEGPDSRGGEDEMSSTSTVRATIRPRETPTPFSVAAAAIAVNTPSRLSNSSLPAQSQSIPPPSRRQHQQADLQTTSGVATVPFQPSPSLSLHLLSPSRAPANATVGSIQSWEDFTVSTPSQSIHSSWREPSQVTERSRNGSSVALGLGQLIPITTSPSPNTSGKSTPRLRRTPRLQSLNEPIYLRRRKSKLMMIGGLVWERRVLRSWLRGLWRRRA
ncbi:hypothetical protein QBC32DRAFT_397553 [Pseudoneurospora amorphoporcata]|uniref:Uncharacterized protein n=1 Tax=Pseudoneurospora amorphoporcata TaxID=241081 RepID=A0AAN6SH11_9PEZI|nr:hypothetical protein QBC32DRAFT_397553 [Pseudoneurospora amorphoporcata]